MEAGWSRFLALLEVAERELLKLDGCEKDSSIAVNDSKWAAKRFVISGFPMEKTQKRLEISKKGGLEVSPKKRSDMPTGNSTVGVKTGLILKISLKRLRVKEEEDEAETSFRPNKVMKPESPSLADPLKNKIMDLGGSESSITLMFRKILTQTDVSHHQNRLLIPFTQVEHHSFLTKEERQVLEKSCRVKIPAILIDTACNLYHVNLALWRMHTGTSYYSLQKQWSDVVKQNHLNPGDCVHLWAFRTHSHLGFILRVVCCVV